MKVQRAKGERVNGARIDGQTRHAVALTRLIRQVIHLEIRPNAGARHTVVRAALWPSWRVEEGQDGQVLRQCFCMYVCAGAAETSEEAARRGERGGRVRERVASVHAFACAGN